MKQIITISIFTLFILLFFNNVSIAQVNYSESFDGSTYPPTGWTASVVDGGTNWARTTVTYYPSGYNPHSGAGMSWYDCYDTYPPGHALLITPSFTLAGRGTSPDSVVFWLFRGNTYSGAYDSCTVFVNTAANLTGATVLGSQLIYSATNFWQRFAYSVPASFTGATNYIIIESVSGWYNDVYVDDVTYTAYPNVPQYYNMTTGTSNNSFPFNVAAGKETQYLFLPGDFGTPTPAPAGNITKVFVYMGGTGSATFTNVVIKLGQSSITSLPASIVTGLTTVDSLVAVPLSSTANNWMSFQLATPFFYNPAQSLILDIYQCGYSGSGGMTVLNSSLSGMRRNYINEASCVPTYAGQDGSTLNFGVNVAPAPPPPPTLVSPLNNSTGLPLTDTLVWNASATATSYRIQLATDSTFNSGIIVNDSTVTTTSRIVTGLSNLTKYFWRVNAKNGAGTSSYSSVWNFTTIFGAPPIPTLLSPINGYFTYNTTDTLSWNVSPNATSYRVQLANDSLFTSIVVDDSTVTATSRIVTGLSGIHTYYWHVRAKNVSGISSYSTIWHFTVGLVGISQNSNEIPKEFKLYNNYPNPFNPSTTIKFDLPKGTDVKIAVYNLIGQEVTTLVNMHMPAGAYSISWDATNFASSVYFYRINAGTFTDIKKMVLVK